MPALRRAAATVLACAVLSGCQDSAPSPGPVPTTGAQEAPGPQQPRFRGRLPVVLQPALGIVNAEGCTPAPRRACSVDGQDAYVPITDPAPATLVSARAVLARGHTSWTAVLRFDAASHRALAHAASTARAAGGMVLVMDQDRRVLAAAPFTLVSGLTITFTGLDKPEAWARVETFDHR